MQQHGKSSKKQPTSPERHYSPDRASSLAQILGANDSKLTGALSQPADQARRADEERKADLGQAQEYYGIPPPGQLQDAGKQNQARRALVNTNWRAKLVLPPSLSKSQYQSLQSMQGKERTPLVDPNLNYSEMSEEKIKMEEKKGSSAKNENRGELYDVEVSQEGMQELNPLVPRASSISLKLSRQSNSRNNNASMPTGERTGQKRKRVDDPQAQIKKQGSSFDGRMGEQDDDSLVIRDVSAYYKNKGRQAAQAQKPQVTSSSYSRNPVKGQGLMADGGSFGSLRQISQLTQPDQGSPSNQGQASQQTVYSNQANSNANSAFMQPVVIGSHSADINRTTSPTVSNINKDVNKASKPKSSSIKHQYYVDTSDIIYMLRSTAKILAGCSLETFQRPDDIQVKTNKDGVVINNQGKGNGFDEQQYSRYAQEVAAGDTEFLQLNEYVEQSTKHTVQQFLQLHRVAYRVYQSEDKTATTSVFFDHNRDKICADLLSMAEQIKNYIKATFKGRQGTARLGFTTELELFGICKNMFEPHLFGHGASNQLHSEQVDHIMPRRIMNEMFQAFQLFRGVQKEGGSTAERLSLLNQASRPQKNLSPNKRIQQVFNTYPQTLLGAFLSLKMLLTCRGKALYSSEKKQFILHKAVFEGDQHAISRLITCKYDGVLFVDKNEIDSCGNSPLVLAIKLQNLDVVKILTDLHCSAKLNPLPTILSGFELAKVLKDRKIVELLMESVQKLKQHYLEIHKEAIFRVLERLPDFSIDLHFECTSSFIPFISNLAPSDTYHIHKQGSNLRLDMHLLGFRKFRSINGNISVLFKGRGSGVNEGELLVVDHDRKTVTSIFEDSVESRMERDLDNIMRDENYQKKFKAEKFKIEPEVDRRGQLVTQQIEDFTAEKHSVLTIYTMTKFKLNTKNVEKLKQYKTFEEYIRFQKVDIIQHGGIQGQTSAAGGMQNTSFAVQDGNWVKSQVTSRAHNNLAATAQHNNLRVDIEQGAEINPILTQGDLTEDRRSRRETSNCRCGAADQNNEAFSFRKVKCTCEKSSRDLSLNNPIIHKSTRKTISASIWLVQDHPLSIQTFLPLLQVLSFSSKQIRKLEQALNRYQLPKDKFPLRARVPLFMTMEATFSFQNLKFERQENAVFDIDALVQEERRKSMALHYANMNDRGSKLLSMHTDEDVARQTITLNRLYSQLKGHDSLGAKDKYENSSSNSSENVEDMYKAMLDEANSDEAKSNQDDSNDDALKRQKQGAPLTKPAAEYSDLPVKEDIKNMSRNSSSNQLDADERSLEHRRRFPDIVCDSIDLTERLAIVAHAQMSETQNTRPDQAKMAGLVASPTNDQNIMTARQLGQVQTMSQINKRHEERKDRKEYLGPYKTLQDNTKFKMTEPIHLKNVRQVDQEKRQANQDLMSKLGAKNNRLTQLDNQYNSNDLFGYELTAQEKRQRNKEMIRQHKLKKSGDSKNEGMKPNERTQLCTSILAANLSPYSPHEGPTQSSNLHKYLSKVGKDAQQKPTKYGSQAENIIDSRIAEKRPEANVTIEKRKLLNNNLVKGEDADLNTESLDKVKKKSHGRQVPPFSLFKKDAPSKGKLTSPMIGWTGNEKSTDESSDANNYNYSTLPGKSQTKTGNISQVGPVTSKRSNAQATISQILANNKSALKRRLEDQNHMTTIESEEIQGTDGTVIDNHSRAGAFGFNSSSSHPYGQGKLDAVQVLNIISKQYPKPQIYDKDYGQSSKKLTGEANKATGPYFQNPYQQDGQISQLVLSSEDKKPLINHNSILNRLHTFVQNNGAPNTESQLLSAIADSDRQQRRPGQNQMPSKSIAQKQRSHTSQPANIVLPNQSTSATVQQLTSKYLPQQPPNTISGHSSTKAAGLSTLVHHLGKRKTSQQHEEQRPKAGYKRSNQPGANNQLGVLLQLKNDATNDVDIKL